MNYIYQKQNWCKEGDRVSQTKGKVKDRIDSIKIFLIYIKERFLIQFDLVKILLQID